MKIAYNASAILANNALSKNDDALSDSLERLSSGLKIASAKDNPAGLAMSKRMNAQIEGIGVATQNANDGISIIEIADGALTEVHDMLQRINELSVKASHGILTDDDREMIDREAQALMKEITRVAEDTEFNGQTILDGSFDLKGYANNNDVKVAYYGDDVKKGNYELDINITFSADGSVDLASSSISNLSANFPADAAIASSDGNVFTITGSDGFEIKLELNTNQTTYAATGVTLDLTGIGAMGMQIGANEGQQLDIRIPKISLQNIGISALDLSTEESATESLGKMDAAIKYISSVRSNLGAYQNRLEHTVNSLDITSENMTGAYSRIMDVDMSEEMTNYSTYQVLTQASTSMLAQANERPAQILQLLQ